MIEPTARGAGSADASGFHHLGDEVVHQGYAVEVVVASFRSPDGQEFTRDIVHHAGAVGVVPLHEDGTVTLVRQWRAPLRRELLEIPAGLRDVTDEPPAETAVRELAEEVGLAAERVELIGTFHNAPGLSDEEVHLFVATGLRAVASDLQGPEERAMTVVRLPLDEVRTGIERGEITDAKTIIGILRLPAT